MVQIIIIDVNSLAAMSLIFMNFGTHARQHHHLTTIMSELFVEANLFRVNTFADRNITNMNNLPRMEKKIMNPADICTTLRLPTRVKASKPAFSLQSVKFRVLK